MKQQGISAAFVACWLPGAAQAQTFARIETQGRFNGIQVIVAVADLNRDGRDDIVAGGRWYKRSETAEDRLTKRPVRVFLGTREGELRRAPAEVIPPIRARTPIWVTDDFNDDGRLDFAVFDAGLYVWAESSGYDNPPQLFRSTPSGQFERSTAVADAVRAVHGARPPEVTSPNPADLHIKSATSADIDQDGDVDLWVQSGGGANVEEHFMVNNGDGTFTVDRDNRATRAVLHNHPPGGSQYWGWDGGHFVDIDNDRDLDLALGHIRDRGPSVIDQYNSVLVNDGAGYYPNRPAARAVLRRLHSGRLAHALRRERQRLRGPVPHEHAKRRPDALARTGRYIQVLGNRRVPLPGGGVWFGDETETWVKGQKATTPERQPNGEPLREQRGLRDSRCRPGRLDSDSGRASVSALVATNATPPPNPRFQRLPSRYRCRTPSYAAAGGWGRGLCHVDRDASGYGAPTAGHPPPALSRTTPTTNTQAAAVLLGSGPQRGLMNAMPAHASAMSETMTNSAGTAAGCSTATTNPAGRPKELATIAICVCIAPLALRSTLKLSRSGAARKRDRFGAVPPAVAGARSSSLQRRDLSGDPQLRDGTAG